MFTSFSQLFALPTLVHTALCTCISVSLAHVPRNGIVSKCSFIQHLMGLYCVLSAILGPGETSGNKINNSSCPREGAILAGDVARFYFDECCTCSVLEQDSAGGWTPWLLLSLRSSGSWGWDSSFESMWEETDETVNWGTWRNREDEVQCQAHGEQE